MLKFLQALVLVKKPEQDLLRETLKGVRELAVAEDFKADEIQNGLLIRARERVAVAVQFGGRRDFYDTIETLSSQQADYRAIITSSKVKSMRIGEIKWILNNKYQTKDKWLIVDLEHIESPKTINFMLYAEGNKQREARSEEPRRKRIFGRRGEHKEQD